MGQFTQGARLALSAAASFSFAQDKVHWVLVAGWSRLVPPGQGADGVRATPRWFGEDDSPRWTGVVPIRFMEGAVVAGDYLILAPWRSISDSLSDVIEGLGKVDGGEGDRAASLMWRADGLDKDLELKGRLFGHRCVARLKIPKSLHLASLVEMEREPPAVVAVRKLRAAAYARDIGIIPARWRFQGEANDKGFYRLLWELTPANGWDDSALAALKGALESFLIGATPR